MVVRKLVALLSPVIMGVIFLVPASANNLLPPEIQQIFDLLGPNGSGTVDFIISRLQLVLVIAVGALILIAVAYALLSSYKYIRSQGDPGEIEEAQKAIKAIFFGLAALFVAIIGMVLVFLFFGLSPSAPEAFQTCVSAPGSIGCIACRDNGASRTCQFCEQSYRAFSRNELPDIDGNGNTDNTDLKAVIDITDILGDGKNCVEPLQGGNAVK